MQAERKCMNNVKLIHVQKKRIKLKYTRLARLVKTTQLNIAMTKESVHRKNLLWLSIYVDTLDASPKGLPYTGLTWELTEMSTESNCLEQRRVRKRSFVLQGITVLSFFHSEMQALCHLDVRGKFLRGKETETKKPLKSYDDTNDQSRFGIFELWRWHRTWQGYPATILYVKIRRPTYWILCTVCSAEYINFPRIFAYLAAYRDVFSTPDTSTQIMLLHKPL